MTYTSCTCYATLILIASFNFTLPLISTESSSFSSQEAMRMYFEEAKNFSQAKKYEDALHAYDSILKLEPNNAEAKKGKVQIFVEFGRYQAAQSQHQAAAHWFLKAILNSPEHNPELFKRYADELSYAAQADVAIPIYHEILSLKLTAAEQRQVHLSLAQAYRWTQQYEQALQEYESLLKLDPNDQQARNGRDQTFIDLGRYHGEKHQHQEAIAWFLKAIVSAPQNRIEPLREYADQLSYGSKADIALPIYQEILDSPISAAEARKTRLSLARALTFVNQYDKALAEYDRLLQMDPHDLEAQKGKAQIFVDFGRYQATKSQHAEAANWFLQAITLDPQRRQELLPAYADQLSYNAQADLAIPLYQEILNSNPSTQDARRIRLSLARAFAWLKQYDRAFNEYDSLLQLDPQDKEVKQAKAQLFIDFGRDQANKEHHQASAEWFLKAMHTDPNRRLEILREYADQLSYNAQAQLAIPLYSEIIEAQPSIPEEKLVRLHLAQALLWAGQDQKALMELEALAKVYPTDKTVQTEQVQIFTRFARSLAEKEAHAESAKWFLKAIELAPERRLEFLREYADQLSYNAQAHLAIPFYQEILASRPLAKEAMLVHQSLGNAYLWTDKYLAALEEYQQVLAQDPSHQQAIKGLNEAQAKFSKKLAAEESRRGKDLEKAFEIFKAKSALQTSVAIEPANKGYREQYAWFLQLYGFTEEAVEQFYALSALTKTCEEQRTLYQILGWDLRSLGKLDDSLYFFQHVYHILPYSTIKDQYAQVLDQLSIENAAKEAALLDELRCNGHHLELQKKLFELYAYARKVRKAAALAKKILACYPEEYVVHFMYAQMLFQTEYYGRAIEQYQLLIAKLPDSAFLYYRLGEAYEKHGCLHAALLAYEKANQLDWHPYLLRAMARVLAIKGCCCPSAEVAAQIVVAENDHLTKELSLAETDLLCRYPQRAAERYKEILKDDAYHPAAVFGLLKSSTYTHNHFDARLAYERWSTIHFQESLQEQLALYYRPAEILALFEIFSNRNKFLTTSSGLTWSSYLPCNMRLNEGYLYSRYSQPHFTTINRNALFVQASKLFSDMYELRARVVGNFYDRIQFSRTDPASGIIIALPSRWHAKNVFNYYLNIKCKAQPNFTANLGHAYYDVIDTEAPFGNPIYNYSNQIGAVALNIKTRDYNFSFFYTYNERLSLFAKMVYGTYSDKNTKQTRSLKLNYLLANYPETNISYNYFFLNFRCPAPIFSENGFFESAYYDPKNFEVHALMLSTQRDYMPNLRLGAEFAGLFFPKANAIGGSAFVFGYYKFSQQLAVRLDLRYFYQSRSVLRNSLGRAYHAESANVELIYGF